MGLNSYSTLCQFRYHKFDALDILHRYSREPADESGGLDSLICPGLAKEIESKAAAEAVWIILRSALHARLFLSTGMHIVCSPVEDERSQKS